MHELGLGRRVEEHRPEVGELHAHRLVVEHRAHRILHPAVRDEDPERREVAAHGEEDRHQQVLRLRQPLPAEEEQADERGLEEERHQAFDGERRAEDVADIMRVVGPVGAELELERDAGRHAHGEVDSEEFPPELRHVLVDRLAGHDVDALHDHQQPDHAQRQRDEEEVVQRRRGELQPRQVDELLRDHRARSLACSAACGAVRRIAAPTSAEPGCRVASLTKAHHSVASRQSLITTTITTWRPIESCQRRFKPAPAAQRRHVRSHAPCQCLGNEEMHCSLETCNHRTDRRSGASGTHLPTVAGCWQMQAAESAARNGPQTQPTPPRADVVHREPRRAAHPGRPRLPHPGGQPRLSRAIRSARDRGRTALLRGLAPLFGALRSRRRVVPAPGGPRLPAHRTDPARPSHAAR